MSTVPIPFEIGRKYNRRENIHGVFGGQMQGGIATPRDCNFIFLFTGEEGEFFDYQDGWTDEGVFVYTGEGQIGEMEFVRGNRPIRDHVQAPITIKLHFLLFWGGDRVEG